MQPRSPQVILEAIISRTVPPDESVAAIEEIAQAVWVSPRLRGDEPIKDRAGFDGLHAAQSRWLVLLGHEAPAVRAAAAWLAAGFPGEPARAALLARLPVETKIVARVSVILGLGAVGKRADARALHPSLGAPSPEERAAAAVAVVRLDPERQALRELAIAAHASLDGRDLPWNEGNLRGLAQALLRERTDEALAVLAEEPRDAPLLMRIVFPDEDRGDDERLLEELGRRQRSALAYVARTGATVDLARYGIPEDLSRFLGLVPPGPLDRRVSGVPLWKTLRRHVRGLADAEPMLRALPRVEVEQLLDDVRSGAYGLLRMTRQRRPIVPLLEGILTP
jgi:hypothetical protein